VIQTLKGQMKDFNPKNCGASNKQELPFFQTNLIDFFILSIDGGTYYIKS
jgi:hypothetical protein